MKMRAPAVPLITVDPYFSLWSFADKLTDENTRHWTGSEQPVKGKVNIDGDTFIFMGKEDGIEPIPQTGLEITPLSTLYTFADGRIRLTAEFTTPLLLDDLDTATRPVSYLKLKAESVDGKKHDVEFLVSLDDAVCLHRKFQYPTEARAVDSAELIGGCVGSVRQHILRRSGDNLRIEWGYAYLAANDKTAEFKIEEIYHKYGIKSNLLSLCFKKDEALLTFAYDDIKSIQYFGDNLSSYWNRNGKSIEKAIEEAFNDYDEVKARCEELEKDLKQKCSNEKYYELLCLAYRQAIAAHKIVVDKDGKLLMISKECFSNGCAATVDVSYPSIPLFLLYNPDLVEAMFRPIFRFAGSDEWFYKFAPHDAGQYPLVNGQVYADLIPDDQMPVEECGNILVAVAAAAIAKNDVSYAAENWEFLQNWVRFLLDCGYDPENQLCTDDFAGHLAHNCNLGIKSIMGVASFGILNKMRGDEEAYEYYISAARKMAAGWLEKARDDESIFRLAFDRPGSFSMKYNAVWDKVFGTGIFPEGAFDKETENHIKRNLNKCGLPLDNRATYTKSDWLIWTATMAPTEEQFNILADSLWYAYNTSESRVPLTDWYDTITGKQIGFQNRTVQGGLFMKVLSDSGKCRFK